MSDSVVIRRRSFVLAAALFLTFMGILSVLGGAEGYTDALFEPDYTILHAPDDGPLAEAGFLPGDSVISVEGIPVVELGMYSRWPRSLSRGPGESLTMVVDRGGELVTGEIVYREQPLSVTKTQAGFLVVLLCFLWAGVWALFIAPGAHSGRLAWIGLAAGLSIPWPNMGSWSGIADHLNVAAEVLLVLLIFRFFLFFPNPKRITKVLLTTVFIFAPWVIYLGCIVVELIFHPRYYHSFGGFLGILLLTYLLLAVATLVHSWISCPKEEVRPSGLGFSLLGFGIGIGGVLLWAVDFLLIPGFDIPGINWAPILFGAVPIGMALGVRKASLGH